MNGVYSPDDVVMENWKLKRLIGQGSFGKVFEAEKNDYGTYKAAIKIITIPRTKSELAEASRFGLTEESARDYFKGAIDRIVKNIALMSQLQGVTNIVDYADYRVIEHTDGIGWDILIRMELLNPLIKRIDNGVMHQDEVVKLGIDICSALEVCHKAGIVHRDVKPANIFVSDHGDYKLGDFGIAKKVGEGTYEYCRQGALAYMAPEVFQMESYDIRSDVYSLGLTMYRLLNENRDAYLPLPPLAVALADQENAFAKRMRGEKLPAPKRANKELTDIVLKACAYKPENRFETPQQMQAALEEWRESRTKMEITMGNDHRTITICPDCQTIGYDRPNYCIKCGKNLMKQKSILLPDMQVTGKICPRCRAWALPYANYCPCCGEGLNYPHSYLTETSDMSPQSNPDEDHFMRTIYDAPPFLKPQEEKMAMVYASPEAMERRHPPQPVEPQITTLPCNNIKPSLMERLFRKKDGNK